MIDDDDQDPSESLKLARRRFVQGAAALLPALAVGCGKPGDGGGGDDSDSDSGGDASSTGPTSTDAASGETGADASTGETAFVPDSVPEDAVLFPRTVLAGEMKPTSVMLAVLAADRGEVTLRLWPHAKGAPVGADAVEVAHEQVCTPDADGFIKVVVEGLAAGAWYGYGFFRDDGAGGFAGRSLLGKVRTAPAPGSKEVVTLGWASCIGAGFALPTYVDPADIRPQKWKTIDHAAGLELDVFIHVGDQLYLDEVFDAGGTYAMYIAAWAAGHGGGYRALYPQQGAYFTWDDHEVTDNGSIDPFAPTAEEAEKTDNAIRAFYTCHPIAASVREDRLWRSFRWGDTVEFIILDGRYDAKIAGENYLSPEQEQFLLDTLKASPCVFKCLVNSAPFATLPASTPENSDRWSQFAQRARIKQFIDDHAITGVVSITGDIHMSYVGRLELAPVTLSDAIPECCVTSGNIWPLVSDFDPAQFSYIEGRPTVPTITFDPAAATIHVRYVYDDGSLAYESTISVA
jgi:phosphodiesterase/alkaline phosphatase D-like protein